MIGTRLGPYEIIEEIGKGGMATVFRAYQPSIGRYVAIKVIHRAIATDDRAVERFQREARLIARLEHPHLLPVYDYDGTHEPPYIVMRYLEGGTLKDVLDKGALPLVDASYLLRQIASALDYAHRQGVIHRDIKPSNIMIDYDGNGFLMDFGIARMAATSGEGLTQTGFAVGTPGYMPPEQGMGMDNITHHADIYALGVMVYQMVTGQMPYTGETPLGIVMKHINDPVPSVRAANPQLPEVLDAALMRALAKKPEDRFDTVTDFADELTRAVGRLTSTSLRPDTLRRIARENVEAIHARRATNQPRIDATMASFESSRASSTRAKPAPPVDPDQPTMTELGATPPVAGATPSPTPGATAYAPPHTPAPAPGVTPPSQVMQAGTPQLGGIYGRLATDEMPTGMTPTDQRAAPPPSGQHPAAAAPSAGRSKLPLIIGVVAALIVIGVIVIAILGGGGGPSPQDLTATADSSTSAALALAAAGTGTQAALVPTATDTLAATRTPLPVRATATLAEGETPPPAQSPTTPAPTIEATLTPAPAASNTEAPTGIVIVPQGDTETPAPPTTAPTETPVPPTNTPSETPPPTETLVPTPTDTPTPTIPEVVVSRQLTLRVGPGTQYPAMGAISPETPPAQILGVSDDGGWYLIVLDDGQQAWLAQSAFIDIAGNVNAVPIAEAPTSTPTPTNTDTPTSTPSSTPEPTSTPTDTPTPTETPVPTSTPTDTSAPTSTLRPTNTEAPAVTDTPVPTETLAPTATLEPTATIEVTQPPSDTPIPPPQASFTWTALATNPLTVQFTDTSTGSPTAFRWTFGDGTTSSQRNPVHNFPGPGTYGVELLVGGLGGTTTFSEEIALEGAPTLPTETPVPPTEEAAVPTPGSGGGGQTGAFPFTEDFQQTSAVDLWDFDATAWQVVMESGERYLTGQGSLRQPAVVLGRTQPEWLAPDVNNLIIRARFNLDPQAAGARIVWHYTPTGYRVLELYPGLMSLRRNAPTPDVFTREPERILQTISAPIQGGIWYEVMIWSSGSRIYVYLDGALVMSAQDTIAPELGGGQIMLQVNNQSRPIRFDDLEIMRADGASTSFATGLLPANWTWSNTTLASIDSEGALRMQGAVTATPQLEGPLENLLLICGMWSEQGGYTIRLREGPSGAVQLRADGGNLWVETLAPDGSAITSEQVPNFYNRGRWEHMAIEMIGSRLVIKRDGGVRYEGTLDTAPASGGISFEARTPTDIFRLDYCGFAGTTGVSNVDARPFYEERERALARPFRELRSDFSDDFSDIFRTDDWWQDGQQAAGDFQINTNVAEHQRYLQMIHSGRPTWRLMRDVIGVEVFESGSSNDHSTDIYTTVEVRFPEGGSGTAWLMARALPTITGADLQGYRLDLTQAADGTRMVTARFVSPSRNEVLFEGPVPAPEGSTALPEWTTLEILTLDEKVAFFVNGIFVGAADGAFQLGGTMALGVEPNTTANFDSVIVRDTSPHDE